MIELIMFLLLIVVIWAVGYVSYISEKQHDDIKEEIKKLNDNINQFKKEIRRTMTVQELIDELSKYPKDKKVYNDHIEENLSGVIVLTHEYTDEEKRKIDEEFERLKREWDEEMERGRDMPTFASRW